MTLAAALSGIDFTDLDNFANGFPHELFAVHRREAPVYWHEPTDNTPDAEGFWSVASYAETLAVLKDPVTYSSVTGGARPFGGTLLQDLAIAGQVLNMMDDPRHSQIRRLVSSGLAPRMISSVENDLRARARRLLDDVVPGEPFDFLVDIAAELPMQMICILLGVPESERHWLFEAIEPQFDFGGARKAALSQLSAEEAGSRMYGYGQELIASKRANPTDDMLSVVANATVDEVDGPAPSDLEVYLFFSLLFSAGAETTRNAVAGGLLSLAEHPDQLHALRADFGKLPTAVEEMVRWTSPSPSKRRTAARDVVLGGQSIAAGQKVQIWEGSANRDADVFDRADEFDIGRKPNPHLGFGQGVHYCLGANLARLELRVLFEELLSRFGAVRVVRPVEWTRSNRHTGIRHLVVELLEES
ncbi:cytochrome P450 [Mycobacterium montefiorense]|uniref:Cytochrome P450 126 n=1 Tax=Mycobacterium montefiorense TaxID=154654 RepID=A0AA37PR15_9MYCO|nr:cytochrome P450 [Mycobacterium montefiorense]GBG36263.1 putative cytochrome P450 126 [Mycobacterium montefiorense]GKU32968.1 putative cytochrome P450 126 [Mycobacterium montefiorense]GKU38562.1 putative cytochrome P450 126 [Mycobacterium montefiorense]GKU46671.1 putative cytochrome P450 126 [Mycobacterium montefiorense]GKU51556.1 putative cytochrome P450 126 [Mycobacterium montefiorense]